MPTEDAYSSGHLVLSHSGTCMCSNVETNLSWTCLVSGLLNFEHPSVLFFCFLTDNHDLRDPTIKVRCREIQYHATESVKRQPVMTYVAQISKTTFLIGGQVFLTVTLVQKKILSTPALKCSRTIALPPASACKMLGQMLKSWNFSFSVFFLAF